jgi:outer-membrane receptor for ferric coprogen and ferric-rhodotorulic acid
LQTNQSVSDATADPALVGAGCCYITLGSVKSAGLDLEVAGEILPGFQVNGGYTYNTNGYGAALKKSLALAEQNPDAFQSLQPKNQLKVWSSYDFDDRWTAGAGLRFESTRYSFGAACTVAGDPLCGTGTMSAFRFVQAPYAVLDLRVAYHFNTSWMAAVNVTNVTDTRYFTTSGNTSGANFYGEPLGVLFSVRGSY